MKKLFTISICLLAITFFAKAQTNIPALITSNQTWSPAGSPYMLTQNSYVDTGVTLTILPGTIVKGTANYLTLAIDGKLIAKGTSSSRIRIDSMELKFSQKSKDVEIDYCDFAGRGSGARIINLYGNNAKVTNCSFVNGYYGIYNMSSSNATIMIIDNCTFDKFNKRGYPIYTSGTKGIISVTNSSFNNFYSMYVYGKIHFEKNTVNDFSRLNFNAYASSKILCNSFTNADYGIELLEYSYYDTTASFEFKYNTLDSLGKYNGLLKFSRSGINDTITRSVFNNNNFLTNKGSSAKVLLYGSNQNKLTSETLDFTNNYWATTDSATIESYIRDYNDDINVYARANSSNYLSSKNTGCGSSKPCKADFKYHVDFDTVTYMDSSFSINGHTSYWSFGDNSTGTGSSVGHTYNSSGNHTVCLYIYDAVANCRDTVCKTITTYDLPKYPEPSFYVAEDTSIKTNLYIIDDSKNTTAKTDYFWDFGDGSTSNLEKPSHTFTTNGPYNLCLTLSDNSLNSSKKYCNSISVKNSGTTGFTIDVLKESDITSLNDINNINVELYPNPSSGNVFLQMKEGMTGDIKVEVLNNMGMVVYKNTYSNYNNGLEMDLNTLSNGLYHVVIRSNSKIGNANVLINK